MEEKMIKQISLFAENKPGRLASVADKFKNAGINIRAFTIAEAGDFGIIRMVVDNPGLAHKVLHDAGFTVSETNVLGVEMEDVPGQLGMIADVLGEKNINIDYAYAFVTRTEKAFLIVRVNDIRGAVRILGASKVKLLDMSDVQNI
ncbi:ACT domain-containing protein [Methanococcoides burtonii]|uniref:Amino acid-binding domain protein n=1 Tax=Methanococcoides burtonii (strain DSM 6242 / NBRC 107633 / OCM 468 / ACE-M) TaxID=259564 RepID=Q12ZA8_METBU|nr:ACT domain-containing protein [Methanococcoides burtonii]ABE51218.1 Amino acid-binding domain protein [Methanococcoides burtonii DSM 6242]